MIDILCFESGMKWLDDSVSFRKIYKGGGGQMILRENLGITSGAFFRPFVVSNYMMR